jgi:Fe-S-cluster-containing hydrogenase component 2
VEDETAVVSLARCIRCGLCVTKCEFNATHLVGKEESEKSAISDNTVEEAWCQNATPNFQFFSKLQWCKKRNSLNFSVNSL